MIKRTIVMALVALFAVGVMAQNPQETTVKVGMLTVPAYTLSIEKDVKMVQNGLNQYLKDAKLKTTKDQGYTAVVDQLIPEIASAPVNLYTKVEEQGKKKNRVAVVTMCAISADLTIDQNQMRERTRDFLQAFVPYLVKYEAGLNMEAEKKNLKQAEKAAASAVAAVNSLDKDIASDQKRIEDKKAEIVKLQGKIKDLEKEIKDLESRIEKNTGKKTEAERKVEDANENVNARQGEVERYRQIAE